MHRLSISCLYRSPWAAACCTVLRLCLRRHPSWGFSLRVQTCAKHMVTSLSCKFDISVLPISWHLVGPEHSRETDWWHHAADSSHAAHRVQRHQNVMERDVLKHLYLPPCHSVIVGPLKKVSNLHVRVKCWRVWCSSSSSSPRNALQLGSTNFHIKGALVTVTVVIMFWNWYEHS